MVLVGHQTRISKTLGLAFAAVCALAATPDVAMASGWKDVGASERIDSSGRLNMLSQRIAASTCNIEANVEPVISRGILAGSRDEVDRIINAIEFGNARMKIIGAETRPATLKFIHSYRKTWDETHGAIDAIYDNAGNQESFELIERSNLDLNAAASYLTSEIAGQYSNPAELVQADAIMLDIAGRQRTRTQQMLKEACAIWSENTPDEAVKQLTATMQLYDVSLRALLDGMPDAGIKPAPTNAIKVKLETQLREWAEIKPMLDQVISGSALSDPEKTDLYLRLNEALIQTNDTMSLYTKYSKHLF